MKTKIKKVAKLVLPRKIKEIYTNAMQAKRYNRDMSRLEVLYKCTFISPKYKLEEQKDFVRQFGEIVNKIKVDMDSFYIYPFDPTIVRPMRTDVSALVSVTPDFDIILKSNLSDIIGNLEDASDFEKAQTVLIQQLQRLQEKIEMSLRQGERQSILKDYFKNLINERPKSLDEALQKVLFYHALFYQVGHWHIGLGRLDMILYPYYENDVKSGKITREKAKNLIRQFVKTLSMQMKSKSLTLIGDTGQYILLGGINQEGENISNEITEIFLEIFTENHFADPKLILRVNDKTDDEIWLKSVKCIATGCGSPLIMNETPIMRNMIDFGYNKDDVWNVGTSACWEPLIIGKSIDQNNPLPSINVTKILLKTLSSKDLFVSFDNLISDFEDNLKEEIDSIIKDKLFDVSPLLSLFSDTSHNRKLDISQGGASYAYHGMQVVGMPNLINSLLNIKKVVFETTSFSISEVKEALKTDYNGYPDLRILFQNNSEKFGANSAEIISLTNEIMDFIGTIVETKTMNGKKLKVGFSSPNYINEGKVTGTSPDGRKGKAPLSVHISPVSSDIDLPEILDFASQLNYCGNKINGNVVDFIVPHSFLRNPEKLVTLLKDACQKGVFEIQLNVLDKQTLIDAKSHPEKYPDLIVRVWGFSAYFNDLPEEYKDNLIKRAELYAAN